MQAPTLFSFITGEHNKIHHFAARLEDSYVSSCFSRALNATHSMLTWNPLPSPEWYMGVQLASTVSG